MKKLLLIGAALACVSFNAQAQYNKTDYYINQNQRQYTHSVFSPYVGVDYAYTLYKFQKVDDGAGTRIDALKDASNGFGASVGLRLTDILSMEFAYQQAFKARKNIAGVKTEHKLSSYGLDLVANTPRDADFEFLGALGVGYYKLKYAFNDGADHKGDDTHIGVRFGLGGQYYVNDHMTLRAMARYNLIKMKGDKKDWDKFGAVKRTIDFTIGTRIYF